MQQLTRIKICGLTRTEDAIAAAKAGADAVGLVFYTPSSRNVSITQATDICRSLPPFITKVGLFVDAEQMLIEEVLAKVAIDVLQFHGQESEQTCAFFGKPYIKVLHIGKEANIAESITRFGSASAVLLDTYVKDQPGGTGKTFDWDRISLECPKPIILAGGLNSDNVRVAIRKVNPYAVDVSGGVESSPGRKDIVKMDKFVKEARDARSCN